MVHAPESRILRILIARRRLLMSVAAGLILLWVLPASYRTATRYLLAWDLTSAIYVGVAFWMIARSTVAGCSIAAARSRGRPIRATPYRWPPLHPMTQHRRRH